jgi:serine phosphatase RsbU (regulator of sigma subunit)
MRKRHALLLGLIGLLLATATAAFLAGVEELALLAASAAALLVLIWAGVKVFRRFLWRVGRKLAFSYFLIGVLPIPLVIVLAGVALYLLAGTLVGHLFRDTILTVHDEVEEATAVAFERFRRGDALPSREGDVIFGLYSKGRRVGGATGLPAAWPEWLVEPGKGEGISRHVPFVLLDDGRVTVAAGIEGDGVAALGVFATDLDRELRERSGIWVDLIAEDSQDEKKKVDVEIFGREVGLQVPGTPRTELKGEFFGTAGRELPWLDRPLLTWFDVLGQARPLPGKAASGTGSGGVRMVAVLNATPRNVYRQVVSSTEEVNAVAWAALLVVAFLLFDIYAVATLMALFLIYGLSRAVNRLSRATDAVRRGDFSVRIPVRRKDQIGELQRGYNEMAGSLQELVAATAQKESLEKELQIARELQQSLLPSSLTTTEAVELASYFEPSAAIGGDYFDLLKQPDGSLVVIVADVSGHGLPAGLRMAMLKAALLMLVEQGLPAAEVFARLDKLVREGQGNAGGRPLVTATLASFFPSTGELELTNAGHVPTYCLRDGRVEEILLPSPPLGVLGDRYARRALRLAPGDLVVWLSDGLVETADADGEPFGFDKIEATLAGGGSATEVRDRLLAAVASHAGGRPPADDRTLVVLRYLPVTAGVRARQAREAAETATVGAA